MDPELSREGRAFGGDERGAGLDDPEPSLCPSDIEGELVLAQGAVGVALGVGERREHQAVSDRTAGAEGEGRVQRHGEALAPRIRGDKHLRRPAFCRAKYADVPARADPQPAPLDQYRQSGLRPGKRARGGDDPSASLREDESSLAPAPRRTLHMPEAASLLIVDDDRFVREFLKDAIAGVPVEIREAGNGAEALARVEEAAPKVVLLDLMMPEMSGLEVLRALREKAPGCRVVVI